MGWKTSKPHYGKDKRIGYHYDIYHVDDKTGKRDLPHSYDIKIEAPTEEKPLIQDIKPPKK